MSAAFLRRINDGNLTSTKPNKARVAPRPPYVGFQLLLSLPHLLFRTENAPIIIVQFRTLFHQPKCPEARYYVQVGSQRAGSSYATTTDVILRICVYKAFMRSVLN